MVFGLWTPIDYFKTAIFEGGSFLYFFEMVMKKVYLIKIFFIVFITSFGGHFVCN